MATPVWKNVFVEVPADGATVWIVRIPWFDTPVQAVFSQGDESFTWTDSGGGTNVIATSAVFKWRSL